jgi:hypothetical protein
MACKVEQAAAINKRVALRHCSLGPDQANALGIAPQGVFPDESGESTFPSVCVIVGLNLVSTTYSYSPLDINSSNDRASFVPCSPNHVFVVEQSLSGVQQRIGVSFRTSARWERLQTLIWSINAKCCIRAGKLTAHNRIMMRTGIGRLGIEILTTQTYPIVVTGTTCSYCNPLGYFHSAQGAQGAAASFRMLRILSRAGVRCKQGHRQTTEQVETLTMSFVE